MKHVNAAMPPFLFLIAAAEQEQPPILRQARAFCAAAAPFHVECHTVVEFVGRHESRR